MKKELRQLDVGNCLMLKIKTEFFLVLNRFCHYCENLEPFAKLKAKVTFRKILRRTLT